MNDKHEWGDDYSQYIKEAQNIAHGRPFYQSNWIYNEQNSEFAPPQYPPGFPLVMAPVVGVFGIDILPLMYMNTFLLVCLMFAIFCYLRKYSSDLTAICIAVIGIYSTNIMGLKSQVFSDIPCALFSTLYLVLRSPLRFSPQRIILLILTALMAILTRSQTLLLLVAEMAYLLVTCIAAIKNKTFSIRFVYNSVSLKVVVGVLVLYVLLNNTLFAAPTSTMAFYGNVFRSGGQDLWSLVGYNVNYLLKQFLSTFHFHMNDPFWQGPVTIMEYAGVVFMTSGFIISIRKGIRVDDIYFILACCMMLVLPVYQGYRYILPLLPLFLYYNYVSLRAFLPIVLPFSKKAIALSITLFYLIMGYDALHSSLGAATIQWTPNNPVDSFTFAYLRTNIGDSDIIVFTKPRALTLYTNKRTMSLATMKSHEDNMKKMQELNIKYVLVRKGLDDGYYNDFVKSISTGTDSVVIDSAYTLHRLK